MKQFKTNLKYIILALVVVTSVLTSPTKASAGWVFTPDYDIPYTVFASNIPPSCNAGIDRSVMLPTSSVTIPGGGATASDTPPGTISSIVWSQITGPNTATITNGSTLEPTFGPGLIQGTYTFRLTVIDNESATCTSDMQVTVTANIPPVSIAGANQFILVNGSVSVNGGGSFDPDGWIVSYSWVPQLGNPTITSIANPSSSFTNITGFTNVGVYTFGLTVTDNSGATAYDYMTVTVSNPVLYQCNDTNDNDGDGYIDYPADPECTEPVDDDESGVVVLLPQCSDLADNDGDGKIDYPDDIGCTGVDDDSEINFECSDSIDNDLDWKIDKDDPGCHRDGDSGNDASYDPEDNHEEDGTRPECDDIADNDGDGKIDFGQDPGCDDVLDDNEFNTGDGGMSGTIDPETSVCPIQAGSNNCSKVLSWSTTNPVGTSEVTNNSGATPDPAVGNSGSRPFIIPYSPSGAEFYLYNNAQQLDMATVYVDCDAGLIWNNLVQICESPPPGLTITFTANPMILNLGESTTLTWSSTNTDYCTSDFFPGHGAISGSQPGVFPTVLPTTYNVWCYNISQSVVIHADVTVSTTAKKQPKYQEPR